MRLSTTVEKISGKCMLHFIFIVTVNSHIQQPTFVNS